MARNLSLLGSGYSLVRKVDKWLVLGADIRFSLKLFLRKEIIKYYQETDDAKTNFCNLTELIYSV